MTRQEKNKFKISFPTFWNLRNFSSNESFFRIQKFGWKLLGFWIGSDVVTTFQLYFLIFNCIEVLIYGIFQCFFFYENRDNLLVLFDAMTPWITQIPTISRILVIVYYRKEIKSLLDYLKDIFQNCEQLNIDILRNSYEIKFFLIATDPQERKINAQANKISSLLSGAMSVFVLFTDTFFITFPLMKNIYRYFTGQSRTFDLPFKAT